MDPAVLAELLRRQRQGQSLQGANEQAHQGDPMAAIAQMANNPGAAAAAKMFSANQQSRYKPVAMGQQGFALPASGEFVSSPMYEDEKNAAREQAKFLKQSTIDAQQQRDAEARRYRAELTALVEGGRNERGAADRELRAEGQQQRFMLGNTIAEIARMRAEAAGDKKAGANEEKRRRQIETDIQKYSSFLDKESVPEFGAALDIVERTLGRYEPGKLPAYGRVVSAVPEWALDNEGQIIRGDMAGAANILLKARSGAAVTEPEMRRFLQEVGSGKGMSEEKFRNGWKNIRESFDAKRHSIAASVSPEVHQEFIGRGGKDWRVKPADKAPAVSADDALINKYLPKKQP